LSTTLITTQNEPSNKEFCALAISDSGIAYARVLYPLQDAAAIFQANQTNDNLPQRPDVLAATTANTIAVNAAATTATKSNTSSSASLSLPSLRENTKLPLLKECEFFPYAQRGQEQLQECLGVIASKYSLRNIKCSVVLHPQYYRLLLINTPNVPANEYKEAAKWQIKDMIDYPLEDITLDIFIPPGFEKLNPAKLHVVAAQASFLRNITNVVRQNLLNLVAIDIHEFAIRNLIAKIARPNIPLGFIHVERDACLLMIIKDAQIRFIRQIPIGTGVDVTSELFDFTKIAGEVERSLDYYIAEIEDDVPTDFYTLPTMNIEDEVDSRLVTAINKKVAITIKPLPLNNIVATDNDGNGTNLSMETQKSCCIAIGGALRQLEENS
jgi:MSHA biogenesis protein MshI